MNILIFRTDRSGPVAESIVIATNLWRQIT